MVVLNGIGIGKKLYGFRIFHTFKKTLQYRISIQISHKVYVSDPSGKSQTNNYYSFNLANHRWFAEFPLLLLVANI